MPKSPPAQLSQPSVQPLSASAPVSDPKPDEEKELDTDAEEEVNALLQEAAEDDRERAIQYNHVSDGADVCASCEDVSSYKHSPCEIHKQPPHSVTVLSPPPPD